MVSAGLFILIFALGLGMPFTFLMPALPMLLAGMRGDIHILLNAAGMAALIALLLTGVGGMLFYAGLIAVPTLLFVPARMQRHPRPVGLLLTDIAIFAALANAAVIAYLSDKGGMEQFIIEGMREGFAAADPAIQTAMDELTSRWGFILLAASTWWWIGLFYAHALLARFLLIRRWGFAIPSLELRPFPLPLSLLAALAVSALATFASSAELAFAAKVIFTILLFPYFILGLSMVHVRSRSWPQRGILLFILYFMIITQIWPALALAGLGLWRQITRRRPEKLP